MTTYAWPTSSGFKVESCSIYLKPNTREFTSQYSGGLQAVDLLGERLCMSLRLPACPASDGALRSAFFNRLRGVHWVSAYHFAQPQPNGTQRGAPVLSASVAQGASALPMSNGSNGFTYLPGDMLGVGGQLFQVADPATFNGSGLATVTVANRVRAVNGISVGAAVTWDRPTTTWRLGSSVAVGYAAYKVSQALDLDLIETW